MAQQNMKYLLEAMISCYRPQLTREINLTYNGQRTTEPTLDCTSPRGRSPAHCPAARISGPGPSSPPGTRRSCP